MARSYRNLLCCARIVLMVSLMLGVRMTPVWGQQIPSVTSPAISDSVKPLILGYDRLVEHYRSLQRIVSDTAAVEPRVTEEGLQRLEIDGLVVDETQTKLGNDFYNVFHRFWKAPDKAFNYTVTILERPAINLGTRVIVQINGETVFQTQLPPRYEVVEALARQAINYVQRSLQRGVGVLPERTTY